MQQRHMVVDVFFFSPEIIRSIVLEVIQSLNMRYHWQPAEKRKT